SVLVSRAGSCQTRLHAPFSSWSAFVLFVQVFRVLQAGAEAAANRGPALAVAIVTDQAIPHGRGVQLSIAAIDASKTHGSRRGGPTGYTALSGARERFAGAQGQICWPRCR
ncbi:MAG: hypothetical protein M3069_12305, partial [Chloroflexota bacterium]|nr:hypothetical protein [Chloroflexota bacterium]